VVFRSRDGLAWQGPASFPRPMASTSPTGRGCSLTRRTRPM